jgi:hypothetical protein
MDTYVSGFSTVDRISALNGKDNNNTEAVVPADLIPYLSAPQEGKKLEQRFENPTSASRKSCYR